VTASRLFANNRARAKRGKKLPLAASGIGNYCQKPYSSAENEVRPMPTRNISLTPEQDAFIDEMLKAGGYRNASEAMRDAIGALKQRAPRKRSSSTSCAFRSGMASRRAIAATIPLSTKTWTPLSTTLPRRTAVSSAWRGIGFPSRQRATSRRS
jgi:putative addiction module CopG family antidote